MSIRQAVEPVPLHQAVAELLELSDERDVWLSRLTAEYRAGFEAGYAVGVVVGRAQVLAEEAAARRAQSSAERDAYRLSKAERRRWSVRGQARSRVTFGEPHPDDYPGRGVA